MDWLDRSKMSVANRIAGEYAQESYNIPPPSIDFQNERVQRYYRQLVDRIYLDKKAKARYHRYMRELNIPKIIALENGYKKVVRAISLSAWDRVGENWKSDFDYALIKVSEDESWIDKKCDAHITWAQDWGHKFILYHFCGRGKAEDEAQFFVSNIQGYIEKAEALMLDWEDDRDIAWVITWLDKVYELTGLRPILFITHNLFKNAKWSTVLAKGYTLWHL